MFCIKAQIPKEVCEVDDELKLSITAENLFAFGFLKVELIETSLWMKLLVCQRKKEIITIA